METEISREQFESYEDCRESGITNMFDVRYVSELTGLDRSTILTIMKTYNELMKKYPEVRK